jgi:hypothetical protein
MTKEDVMSSARSRIGVAVCLSAALVLATVPSAAQVQTGEIFGKVTDSTGAVLPGVTVTLESPALIRPQSVVTAVSGGYRIPNLPIGAYAVRFELAGFRSHLQQDVRVQAGFNAEISPKLELSTVQETVTVSGESPVVDTKQVSTGGSFNLDTLANIPSARDPWVILQMTPSVIMSGTNVGGSQSGQQNGYAALGGGQGNSMWNVDGATITDMAATGASPVYYDFDSFEEIQITTGGNDASQQTGGVNINLITKSGGNKLRGSGRFFMIDEAWQADNVTQELFIRGASGGNPIQGIQDYGAEIGGPIVVNRAWFWGGYGKQDITVGVNNFFEQNTECSRFYTAANRTYDQLDAIQACLMPDLTVLENYNAKGQVQIANPHKATFLFTRGDKIRNARGAGVNNPPETTTRQTGPVNLYKFTHNWVVTNAMALETSAQYTGGGFLLDFHEDSLADVQRAFDRGTSLNSRSGTRSQFWRPTTEVKTDGSLFASRLLGGDHSMKFGFRWRSTPYDSASHIGGNATARFRFDVPEFADLHRDSFTRSDMSVISTYFSDSYNRGRFRFTLGIRYDHQNDAALSATVPANPIIPHLLPAVEFKGADSGVIYDDWSPRLSMTVDLRGNGKTVAKASVARYFGQGIFTAGTLNPVGAVTLQYNWRDPNGDRIIQANELIDRFNVPCAAGAFCEPRSTSGNYVITAPASPTTQNSVDPNLKNDRTDEVIVGIDHELMRNFGVGISYIYRQYDQFQDDYRNGESSDMFVRRTYTETDPRFVGRTPTATYYDLAPGLSRPPNIVTLRNYGFYRDYHGVELTARKRFSNRWMLNGSLTLNSSTQHYTPDSYNDPTNIEYLDGFVGSSLDTEWLIKLGGMYQFGWGINASAFVTGRDGFLYNEVVNVPSRSGGLGSINAQIAPQGATRYDDVWTFDARAEKWFQIRGLKLTASVDVFNIANANTVVGQTNTLNSVNYLRISEILAPRVLRLGVRFSF